MKLHRWLRAVSGSILAAGSAACGCAPGSEPPIPSGTAAVPEVVSSRDLGVRRGGRLDWCHASNLIAFDAVTPKRTTEVYTIRPDGSDVRCVTCRFKNMPKTVRGNPAWHPSCEFMVIQVSGKHHTKTRFEFLSFGIHNDLWIVDADGSRAQRIVVADPLGASLNPRFSDDGRRLFWSVKEKTGRRVRQSALGRTPGSENPFAGWHLAIADFERPEGGRAEIERRVDLYRGEGGYFEAQAMLGDTILFSHTPGGQRFVESLYRARSDGSDRVALTAVPSTAWNASGMPSPGRSLVTFTSSRSFDWSYLRDKRSKLRLELWALTGGGDLVQLTDFNKELPDQSKRVIVADHAWGPSGRDIAVYSSAIGGDGTVRQRITILSLNEAF